MFKYLIASLPIQTILTLLPEMFMPKLNEIVQSNLQDESSRLYIRKTAYIAKKIAELAYKIYGFCVKFYTFQDLDMAEFQKTLSWTKESSKDLNVKVSEMDAELSNGGSLYINPESYQHLADERQALLEENTKLYETNSKLLIEIADYKKQIDTISELFQGTDPDFVEIHNYVKKICKGNVVGVEQDAQPTNVTDKNVCAPAIVEQDARSTNVTDNAFANVCATEEGENK